MAASPPTARKTQSQRTEESERRLITAAVELIAEQGFEKTTVAQIGRRAGYSHSMVHVRFGSKDALLKTLFETHWQRRLIAEGHETASGLRRVLGMVDQVLDVHDADRDGVRAVIMLMLELPTHAAHLKPWHRQWLERYYDHMIECFRAGEQDGSIRTGLDYRAEAERFVAYGTGLGFMWALDWDGYDFAAALREWREHLLHTYTRQARSGRGRRN